jgi:hypothetical protein
MSEASYNSQIAAKRVFNKVNIYEKAPLMFLKGFG